MLSLDVVRAVIKGNGTNKTTKDLTRRQKDGQSEMMVYETRALNKGIEPLAGYGVPFVHFIDWLGHKG